MNIPTPLKRFGKVSLTALLPLTLSFGAVAAGHIALFEKFTNVGCGPCALLAPQTDSLLDMRLGDVVEIAYHGNVPYPNDEYYLPVRNQVGERIDFYTPPGYPTIIIDGSYTTARIPDIESRLEWIKMTVEPSVVLNLESAVEGDVLDVKVSATALEGNLGSDLRLFVAAVEQEVLPERPAFNGQTVFHNEFRQFLTPNTGDPLSGFSVAGDSFSRDYQWTIERFENIDELAVVAWLQDMSTKKVVETAFVPRPPRSVRDARVVRVADTPAEVCSPLFSGRLWLRNTGGENITSCDITIDIDGHIHSCPWRGDLPYLATEEIQIAPFSDFELNPDADQSKILIKATAINGSEDEGESFPLSLSHTVTGTKAIKLLLCTDNKPEEISWQLLDNSGTVVAESEPYTERRQRYETLLPINSDGCYTLVFHDAGGDGISGNFGDGFYRLYETDGSNDKELIQSSFRSADHTQIFRAVDIVPASVAAPSVSTLIVSNLAFHNLLFPMGGKVDVYAIDGQLMTTARFSPGETLDLNSLGKGIYAVRCELDDNHQTITINID